MRVLVLLLLSCLACLPARADWPPAPPPTILLSTVDASGSPRSGQVAAGGVPLPRSAAVTDVSRLRVLDAGGNPLPAQLRVLARWNAGRDDAAAPIQWLLVDAPAPPAGTHLRLQTDALPGVSPPPATPLSITRTGARFNIDTGAARFVVDPPGGAMFAEVRAADGTLLGTGERFVFGVEGGASFEATEVRFARIDAQGPLSATLSVEWLTGMPALGGGRVALRRQYRFDAGSPTAVVRSALAWEGERCGNPEAVACAAGINALALRTARDALLPAASGARSVHVLAQVGAPVDTATLGPARRPTCASCAATRAPSRRLSSWRSPASPARARARTAARWRSRSPAVRRWAWRLHAWTTTNRRRCA